MKRRICVITGSRAEYGLLYWLMKEIQESNELDLQIVVTGMHLSPEFGLTYKEIEKDGFFINKKVEMILSADTPSAITKSTGLGMIGFADALLELQPDIVVVLGDRFEIFAASFSTMIARIPIAHIGGGETTVGAFDEAIRHSITKMAFLHFVATDVYRNRVLQLGEEPERVFNVGGMGVDCIMKTRLLGKEQLEKELDFTFGPKNLLVTFHPVTLEKRTSSDQFTELLAALETLDDTHIIFTAPNADTDGRVIKTLIDDFVSKHPRGSIAFTSMGQVNFLSTLQYIDAVVGNSSSGLAEAPSFKIGTINIGDRQKGRVIAKSVISCLPEKDSIVNAMKKLYSDAFQKLLNTFINPYGKVGASEKIIAILKKYQIENNIKKTFYDVNFNVKL
jgi:GDP/UDP-N,N'-diacetylbacillosamine 2-epimerase (hydrolysing)